MALIINDLCIACDVCLAPCPNKAITAGDPPLHRVGDIGSSEGDFTLEELLLTMRRVTKKSA